MEVKKAKIDDNYLSRLVDLVEEYDQEFQLKGEEAFAAELEEEVHLLVVKRNRGGESLSAIWPKVMLLGAAALVISVIPLALVSEPPLQNLKGVVTSEDPSCAVGLWSPDQAIEFNLASAQFHSGKKRSIPLITDCRKAGLYLTVRMHHADHSETVYTSDSLHRGKQAVQIDGDVLYTTPQTTRLEIVESYSPQETFKATDTMIVIDIINSTHSERSLDESK